MFHHLDTYSHHHAYCAQERYREAEQERMAAEIRTRRRIRFYYPALSSFGLWMAAYGMRLHRRYSQHHHFPIISSQPIRRNA